MLPFSRRGFRGPWIPVDKKRLPSLRAHIFKHIAIEDNNYAMNLADSDVIFCVNIVQLAERMLFHKWGRRTPSHLDGF